MSINLQKDFSLIALISLKEQTLRSFLALYVFNIKAGQPSNS